MELDLYGIMVLWFLTSQSQGFGEGKKVFGTWWWSRKPFARRELQVLVLRVGDLQPRSNTPANVKYHHYFEVVSIT